MEGLTRLVTESLARHGFDRPLDYRRLHWSRWFRCESHHSLLFVPSKPGVFAVAEEIMGLSPATNQGAADEFVRPPEPSSADAVRDRVSDPVKPSDSGLDLVAAAPGARRMLAVTQFFEDDDMAFVLDRMLSTQNPLRARLVSGRYFVRFVVIEDPTQRRSICSALNQWIVSATEKVTGIGSHFASSLELTPATEYIPPANDAQPSLFENDVHVGRALLPATAATTPQWQAEKSSITPAHPQATAPQLDSGAAANIHCPSPFPSGF
ncbi:MAG: hypothetical protein WA830_16640 [Candidatus Sulfotelmatobacter sp.]